MGNSYFSRLNLLLLMSIIMINYASSSEQGTIAESSTSIQQQWFEYISQSESDARHLAKVGTIRIASPLQYWVLARHGVNVCAIRFTEFRRNHQGEPDIGDEKEEFFAKYETILLQESQKIADQPVQTKIASKKPNFWRFYRGTQSVNCGRFDLHWWYPNWLSLAVDNFDPDRRNFSNNVELALTPWTNAKDIDIQDSRLVWHKYIPARDFTKYSQPPQKISPDQLFSPGNVPRH